MHRYFHENAERRFATELNDFLFWRKGKFLRPNEKEKIIASYLREEIDDFLSIKKYIFRDYNFLSQAPAHFAVQNVMHSFQISINPFLR